MVQRAWLFSYAGRLFVDFGSCFPRLARSSAWVFVYLWVGCPSAADVRHPVLPEAFDLCTLVPPSPVPHPTRLSAIAMRAVGLLVPSPLTNIIHAMLSNAWSSTATYLVRATGDKVHMGAAAIAPRVDRRRSSSPPSQRPRWRQKEPQQGSNLLRCRVRR